MGADGSPGACNFLNRPTLRLLRNRSLGRCHQPVRSPSDSRYSLLGSGQGCSRTARIGRAQFYRARSASKQGTCPLPPYSSNSCFFFPIFLSVPFQRRTILSLCLIQISVLTISEKIKNSCRCSFTTATTGKHPKAANAPPDE